MATHGIDAPRPVRRPRCVGAAWDDDDGHLAGARSARADGDRGDAGRPRRDLGRRSAQPAEPARHPRAGHLRGPVVPLGPLGPRRRPRRQAGGDDRRRRQRVPDRARRSPTRSSTSPCSSARRSGCSPTRTTTSRSGPGVQWALRHLPFYGRWYRFLLFWPGVRRRPRAPHASTPTTPTSSGRSARSTTSPGRCSPSGSTSQVGDDPDLLAKVVPDYPATGKRTLQDNGSWLRTLTRDDVDLVRTAIDRIEPDAVVTERRRAPRGRRDRLRHRVPRQPLPLADGDRRAGTAS